MSRSSLPLARLAAEFAVIVIGVLVALLAESAWAQRGERVEEREALQRIRQDLTGDSADLRNDDLWLALAQGSGAEAARVLNGTDTLPPRAALAVVYGAILENRPRNEIGTWQDLSSSGRSGLISDPGLRRRLVRFFSERENRELRRNELPTELRTRVLSVVPPEYAAEVLRECVRRSASSVLDAGAREDAFQTLSTCPVEPRGGAEPYLNRILSFPDNDLHLNHLRYELGNVENQQARIREAFDSVQVALDRAIADAG